MSRPQSPSMWNDVLGGLSVLFIFLVPFFPDEKLIRPKMQFLELGLFVLIALIGIRVFLSCRWPFQIKEKRSLTILPFSIGIWILVQTTLYFLSSEKISREQRI